MSAVPTRLTALSTACCLLLAPVLAPAADLAKSEAMLRTRGSPVQVEGLWCGIGLLAGTTISIKQRFQDVSGEVTTRRGRKREVQGRVVGSAVRVSAERYGELGMEVAGDEMRIASASGAYAIGIGQGFRRAAPAGCSQGS